MGPRTALSAVERVQPGRQCPSMSVRIKRIERMRMRIRRRMRLYMMREERLEGGRGRKGWGEDDIRVDSKCV
jgi:ribosomal protein L19